MPKYSFPGSINLPDNLDHDDEAVFVIHTRVDFSGKKTTKQSGAQRVNQCRLEDATLISGDDAVKFMDQMAANRIERENKELSDALADDPEE